MTTTIGILLFDGTEELDAIGPWEVFTVAADHAPGGVSVMTVSQSGDVVTCAKGLRVLPGP